MPITWKNVGGDTGHREAGWLTQGAADSMNQGINALRGILNEQRQTEQQNFQTTRKNNTAAYLDGLQQYGSVDELEAAQTSGALEALRSSLGPNIDRNVVRNAASERLNALRTQETQANEFEKDRLQRDVAPLVESLRGEILGGNANALDSVTEEQQSQLTSAGVWDELVGFQKEQRQAGEDRSYLNEKRDRERDDWSSDDQINNALAAIDPAQPFYMQRDQYMESIKGLPYQKQGPAIEAFQRKYSMDGALSPEDQEYAAFEGQRIDAGFNARAQEVQGQIASAQAEIERLPAGARNDLGLKTEADVLNRLAQDFAIDTDYFTANDIQTGFKQLSEAVRNEIEKISGFRELGYDVNGIIYDAARRSLFAQPTDKDGKPEIDLMDAKRLVPGILAEYAEGNFIAKNELLQQQIADNTAVLNNLESERIAAQQNLMSTIRERARTARQAEWDTRDLYGSIRIGNQP